MFQKWVYPRVLWYCYTNKLIHTITKPVRPKTIPINIFSNSYQDDQKLEVWCMLIYQITSQFTI